MCPFYKKWYGVRVMSDTNMNNCNKLRIFACTLLDHPFSTYAKFPKNQNFVPPVADTQAWDKKY